MKHTLRERVLALAGLVQAVQLVQHVARRGMADARELETCLHSLFQLDPPNVEAVYGEVGALRTGLQVLVNQLSQGNGARDMELTRYVVSLLHLERKLAQRPDMLEALREGLERARRQSEHFHLSHENVVASLAGLYSDTLSQIPPRIMVSGEPNFLAIEDNASRIRALLLAAVRSAVLWRQCGGSRWQLLFGRKAMLEEARRLLQEEAQPLLRH